MLLTRTLPFVSSIRLRYADYGMEGNPDFLYMGTVTANGFVELISSDAELFGPVGNIRCHFRIDLFRIMWTLCVFFVNRVRLVRFWCIVMLGHLIFLSFVLHRCG